MHKLCERGEGGREREYSERLNVYAYVYYYTDSEMCIGHFGTTFVVFFYQISLPHVF